MHKVLILVPFAFDEKGLANRRAQQEAVELGPDVQFDYRPVKAGPALYDSWHDYVLADLSLLEAGLTAQEDGYDAVCIDTMSDSGVSALRSVLDIPVIGPGKASYLVALMLGEQVLGAHAMGSLDEPLHEEPPGVRACRQVRLHPVHQRAAGRRKPARREGGRGLPEAPRRRTPVHRATGRR